MRQFETRKKLNEDFSKVKLKMKNLLGECLEKELQFNVNPQSENLSIYFIDRMGEFTFNYDCYYFGELSHIKNGNTIPLDELIKKVKDFKHGANR